VVFGPGPCADHRPALLLSTRLPNKPAARVLLWGWLDGASRGNGALRIEARQGVLLRTTVVITTCSWQCRSFGWIEPQLLTSSELRLVNRPNTPVTLM
jgi:hypothetical protein